jgi:hypothetical protein
MLNSFIQAAWSSFLTGLFNMTRGRGLSDGEGIVDLWSKGSSFFIVGITICMITNSLVGVFYFMLITPFWTKIGKSHQLIFLDEKVINKPDFILLDNFVDLLFGKPKDINKLKYKTIVYNILYTLTTLPIFVLLFGIFSYFDLVTTPLVIGAAMLLLWPFFVIPLRYTDSVWKQWATAEFIIGGYFGFVAAVITKLITLFHPNLDLRLFQLLQGC